MQDHPFTRLRAHSNHSLYIPLAYSLGVVTDDLGLGCPLLCPHIAWYIIVWWINSENQADTSQTMINWQVFHCASSLVCSVCQGGKEWQCMCQGNMIPKDLNWKYCGTMFLNEIFLLHFLFLRYKISFKRWVFLFCCCWLVCFLLFLS